MLELHRVRLYARSGQGGVSAVVILGADNACEVATRLDEPATTTVAVTPSLKADARLDVWRDGMRQEVDGTGLLAAAHVLLGRDGRGPIRFETGGRVIPVLREADGRLRYRATLSHEIVGHFDGAEVLSALGVPPMRVPGDMPFGLAATQRRILLVPIEGVATLGVIRPAFTRLAAWSAAHEQAPVLAYAPAPADAGGADFMVRLFDPLAGRSEEAPGPEAIAALVGTLARRGLTGGLRPVAIVQGRFNAPAINLQARAELVVSEKGMVGRSEIKVWVGGEVRHLGFAAVDGPGIAGAAVFENLRLGA